MEILAALEPSPYPVISLYLNLAPNEVGRDDHQAFIRKVFADRAKPLRQGSPERDSFAKDAERIREYLEAKRDPAWHGLAIFACAGAELFEAIPLEAPLGEHWLFVGSVPHLYPLAKLIDTFPRYASVLLDTNKARILTFSLAAVERDEKVVNDKTRRNSQGGWSQSRYQRRADNIHLHHMKEVADTLERIVRQDGINQVVIAGDEVAIPKLREVLPAPLAEKVVDVIKLHPHAADILERSLAAVREKDAETDAEKVQQLIDAWQSGGLGVAGPEATLSAFQLGQVEELIITGSPETLKTVQKMPEDSPTGDLLVETSAPQGAGDEERLKLAGELVRRAEQTAARIRFIEDPKLLEDLGGVGALLRFRI
jgi:peptide subunit release factor 1 (eRF1)